MIDAQKLEVVIDHASPVSALLTQPSRAKACFVFAHGAGAGMTHPFMECVASGLAERGVASMARARSLQARLSGVLAMILCAALGVGQRRHREHQRQRTGSGKQDGTMQ